MEMKIEVKSWKFAENDSKQKTIGGEYSVKCGANEIANASFNIGYQATIIPIPSALMVKVEALDEEIRQAIIKNFSN